MTKTKNKLKQKAEKLISLSTKIDYKDKVFYISLLHRLSDVDLRKVIKEVEKL